VKKELTTGIPARKQKQEIVHFTFVILHLTLRDGPINGKCIM
jgi:hypothetical protein